MKHPKISNELMRMRDTDYALRIQWRDKHDDPTWVGEVERMDRTHAKRLKAIVEKYGWPTINMVGEKASDAAWLLVQHADRDLDFQLHCLDLMKAGGNVKPLNIAYLTDRTLVAQGKPQIYGTQFYRPNGKDEYIPRPIREPESVDARRTEIGISTLEEYSKVINS